MQMRRSKKNSDLPDNLYQNGKYFKYMHPITGKAKSLNCTRKEAIEAARIANNALKAKPDMSHRLLDTQNTIDSIIDGFIKEYIPIRQWRENTTVEAKYKLNIYRKKFGHYPIQAMTVLVLKDYLSTLSPNSYIKHRQLWIHIFKYAISAGLTEFNCAEATLKLRPPKRKRQRLTEETYKAIYDAADPWFQNAMQLAKISLQRPSDLCNIQYSDIKDGYLYVQQSKSEGLQTANLKIQVWPELKAAIQATRTVPLSPFILHRHSKRRTSDKQRIDNSVTADFLSKTFSKYRKLAKIEVEDGRSAPTFYEIVSLGARWYLDNGYPKSFVQALKGHVSDKTTDIYLDDDQTKWTVVSV